MKKRFKIIVLQNASLITMAVYQTILDRHTIRNYDPEYTIPKDILEKILNVVQLTPNSMSVQGVDAICVTNKAKLQEITDNVLACLPEDMANYMNSRKEKFKVTNVVSCDASAVVYMVKNERSNNDCKLDAGICAYAICMAAANFGLDTMCHSVCASPGTAKVLGLPEDAVLMGVAIGKRRPDAYISKRQTLNKITIIE